MMQIVNFRFAGHLEVKEPSVKHQQLPSFELAAILRGDMRLRMRYCEGNAKLRKLCAVLNANVISERFLSLTGYFNDDTTEVLLVLFIIAFMQCIYKYTPGIKHVSRAYKVVAILLLQLVYTVHVMLLQILKFHTFTLVLSEVCAQCPIWPFFVVPWGNAFQVHITEV